MRYRSAIIVIAALGGCSSLIDRGTLSQTVTTRATVLAEASFSDPRVREQSIDVLPRFEHDEPTLWHVARHVGIVVTKDGKGSPFTAKGLGSSVDCGLYEEPRCRQFIVARSRFIRAEAFDPGWDGLGEIRDVFVRTKIVSEPIGAFGAALAAAGVLSCLDGTRAIAWRGSRTHATVTIGFGFSDVPIDHDAAIVEGMRESRPTRGVDCPFTRDRLEDNVLLAENAH